MAPAPAAVSVREALRVASAGLVVENVVLRQGEQKQLSSGEVLRFAAITGGADGDAQSGHPWALASATLLAVGLLMGRRWLLV